MSDDLEFASVAKELRSLEEPARQELRSLTGALMERVALAQLAGISFNGLRRMYDILGYPTVITTAEYKARYARGGLAGRVVDVMPDATWRGGIELIEDEDPETTTPFEQAVVDLDRRLHIWATLRRVDKMAGLSTFAVLLVGAVGSLSEELPKAKKPDDLLYLSPYIGGGSPTPFGGGGVTGSLDAACTVHSWVQDIEDPRFGLPLFYQLRRTTFGTQALNAPVHWSRIIHVAENLLEDDVYGAPTLERVWNLFDDLDKVTGGGAEAFFLRVNKGLQLDIDKDVKTLSEAEKESLRQQIEDYQHQVSRILRTRGTKINELGSDVANFANPADAIITQIAGSRAIPKRILTGSEMGELASSQDRENFRDQVNGRQESYAGPFMVRALFDRLISYNYLPTPKQYDVKFAHIQTLTEVEKAAGALQWAQTNTAQGAPVYTGAQIRNHWYGMEPLTDEEIKSEQEIKAAGQPQQPAVEPPVSDKKAFPKAAEAHSYASTQVNLVGDLRERILNLGRAIPEADLAGKGREPQPHVTVKYGLTDNQGLGDLVRNFGPVVLTLGKVGMFSADDYDVLQVAVDSPDLERLNKLIVAGCESVDTQPFYMPHATIAYVQKGLGEQWVGIEVGGSMVAREIEFMPADDGLSTTYTLQGDVRAAESPSDDEITRVLEAAILEGNQHVVARICGFETLGDVDGHPFHGNQWTKQFEKEGGFLSAPSEALDLIAHGEKATVAPEDVRGVLERARKSNVVTDLTHLTIEGTPIFAGGLNLPRSSMPQIPKEHQAAFLEELKTRGIKVVRESVPPSTLLPTQNEISANRVGEKLKEYDSGKKDLRPILVSKDDKVLDGHHRWAVMAAVDAESPKLHVTIPVIRIMAGYKTALKEMGAYTKAHKIENRVLGDVSGHPFHGNQWTEGQGAALAKLEALPNHPDRPGDKVSPFEQSTEDYNVIDNLAEGDFSFEEITPTAEMKATQGDINEKKVAGLIRDYDKWAQSASQKLVDEYVDEPGVHGVPTLVIKDGKQIIFDGHNRFAAAFLLGKPVKAAVVRLGEDA